MHRGALCFLGRALHFLSGVVNGTYQRTQLVDGLVDGVGDRAGEVLGYRCLGCQVTVGQIADFVEQPQNCRLVTLGSISK